MRSFCLLNKSESLSYNYRKSGCNNFSDGRQSISRALIWIKLSVSTVRRGQLLNTKMSELCGTILRMYVGVRNLWHLPQAVQHFAIRMHSEHDILRGGVMNEGSFGVDKKYVRYPDFLHQSAIKGHALVGVAGKGQSLVLPVMSQVQGHGEVLKHTIQSAICLNRNSLNSSLISIPRALYIRKKNRLFVNTSRVLGNTGC